MEADRSTCGSQNWGACRESSLCAGLSCRRTLMRSRKQKEVSMARVRHMFISCAEYSGYFLIYKLTPYSTRFSFEHLFAVNF